MDLLIAKNNWALLLAVVLLITVIAVVLLQLLARTRYGKLRRRNRARTAARRQLDDAMAVARKARSKLDRLQQRAKSVPPRRLQEAEDALQDARMLEKIADDKWQIAANHVRRVIVEEFPPTRHESLRARYLPDDNADHKPFTF